MISPDLLCTHLRKNNVLSLKCYIKSLSKDLTNIFTAVRTGFWMNHDTNLSRSSVNQIWISKKKLKRSYRDCKFKILFFFL